MGAKLRPTFRRQAGQVVLAIVRSGLQPRRGPHHGTAAHPMRGKDVTAAVHPDDRGGQHVGLWGDLLVEVDDA